MGKYSNVRVKNLKNTVDEAISELKSKNLNELSKK